MQSHLAVAHVSTHSYEVMAAERALRQVVAGFSAGEGQVENMEGYKVALNDR